MKEADYELVLDVMHKHREEVVSLMALARIAHDVHHVSNLVVTHERGDVLTRDGSSLDDLRGA